MGAGTAIQVSGLAKIGLQRLLEAIDEALVADPLTETRFRMPQSEGAALAALAGIGNCCSSFRLSLFFLVVVSVGVKVLDPAGRT